MDPTSPTCCYHTLWCCTGDPTTMICNPNLTEVRREEQHHLLCGWFIYFNDCSGVTIMSKGCPKESNQTDDEGCLCVWDFSEYPWADSTERMMCKLLNINNMAEPWQITVIWSQSVKEEQIFCQKTFQLHSNKFLNTRRTISTNNLYETCWWLLFFSFVSVFYFKI